MRGNIGLDLTKTRLVQVTNSLSVYEYKGFIECISRDITEMDHLIHWSVFVP